MFSGGTVGFVSSSTLYNVCGFGWKYSSDVGYMFVFSGGGVFVYNKQGNSDYFYKLMAL